MPIQTNHPSIHLVFGPPAAGKTTYARQLADGLGVSSLIAYTRKKA